MNTPVNGNRQSATRGRIDHAIHGGSAIYRFYRDLPGLFMVLILGLLTGVPSGCQPAEKEPAKPNIVLILADDLGYGDVGFLNPKSKIPTPHLDELAGEGMSFTNAHAPAAVCTPTRYSILTGRYPWRSRLKQGVLWIWDDPLIEPGSFTMGGMLGEAGYHTALIGKWHLGWDWPTLDGKEPNRQTHGKNVDFTGTIPGGPVDRGFDFYFGDDVPGFPPHAFIGNDRLVEPPDAWNETGPGIPGPMAEGWKYENLLPDVTEKAVSYLQERAAMEAEQPFFLFFSLTAPHTPIAPVEEVSGKSEAGRYGDFVYQLDRSVGRVLHTLDSLGISENTLVLFSSDNGAIPVDGTNYTGRFGSLYEYGHDPNGELRGVKSDAWEGGHRVPLVARWEHQIPAGSESDELVSLTDLAATFADLTGTSLADTVATDSYSLLPLLLDQPGAKGRANLVTQSGNGILSYHRDPWKLVLSSGSGGSWSKPTGELPHRVDVDGDTVWKNVQLYNLQNDREEQVNLAARHPRLVEAMIGSLSRQIRRGRSTPGPAAGEITAPWKQVSWIAGVPDPVVYRDPFFEQRFQRHDEGFTGGDATYSVPLPDGRTAWIFGDTFIGDVKADNKTRVKQDPIYVRNSIVVGDGNHVETLYSRHQGKNASLVIHPDAYRSDGSLVEDSVWFWPGDGYVEEGKLNLFLSEFIRSDTGMWGFSWEGTWLATFLLPEMEQESLVRLPELTRTGVHLGHAVYPGPDYTYVYGAGDKKPHAARYPSGDMEAGWEFYDGTRWREDPLAIAPMSDLHGSEQFTVFKLGQTYILVTQMSAIGDAICSFTSETPYGPWGNRQNLYETPLPDSTKNLFTYNAVAHPQFIRDEMLLISYNMNSFRLQDHFENAGIYRPRFIRVPLEMIDQGLVETNYSGK